jgi:hypothetical protein
MVGINLANLDGFLANFGVAQELSDALVEPGGEVAVIQVDERVRVFVVHDFVGIVPLCIGADRDEVFGFAGNVHSRGMGVALGLPILGEQQFQGLFVPDRENDHRLADLGAQFGESAVEYLANLLELVGDLAGFFFAGITDHREVWSADFDPDIFGGGETHSRKKCEQGNNKNGKHGAKDAR